MSSLGYEWSIRTVQNYLRIANNLRRYRKAKASTMRKAARSKIIQNIGRIYMYTGSLRSEPMRNLERAKLNVLRSLIHAKRKGSGKVHVSRKAQLWAATFITYLLRYANRLHTYQSVRMMLKHKYSVKRQNRKTKLQKRLFLIIAKLKKHIYLIENDHVRKHEEYKLKLLQSFMNVKLDYETLV